jgi:hypothetical protein
MTLPLSKGSGFFSNLLEKDLNGIILNNPQTFDFVLPQKKLHK